MFSSLATLVLALVGSVQATANQTTKWERRVYTTNTLKGFKKDFPSLWPPGYGGESARERVVLDVGANNGDLYTLLAFKKGHTVFSFEPSPMVGLLFRDVMKNNQVDTAFVNLRPANETELSVQRTVTIPYGNKSIQPKVFFIPIGLSSQSGLASLHQSPCADLAKCGKVNRLVSENRKGSVQVPIFRLDDVILPINKRKIWFMKIDVEGHELEVLQGARTLLKEVHIPYIAVEFSSNGRKDIDWGVSLLDELYNQGYVCHHLRGFGKCHDASFRSPSLKCNYPFSLSEEVEAPTFEEYTEVFEIRPGKEKKRRAMADLMCAHRSVMS